jgi:ABC-type nitrate/sulfonate/bicarbonate transport system substrate-binding protein
MIRAKIPHRDAVRTRYLILLVVMAVWFREGRAEVLKIAIPSTTQAVLAFTIARDKGYYRAEGLDVELILVSAPIASRALLSGDVAVATVGGAGLPPVLRGSPFKFLFTTYNRAMFWLFAKPEIRDVRGLKGKRIGVSGIGSGPDSLLREILRQNGLDANRDVAVLSLGVMPTIFTGLQAGTVDAAMLSPRLRSKRRKPDFASSFLFRSRIWSSCKAAFSSGTLRCNRIGRKWNDSCAAPTRDFSISRKIEPERFPSSLATCN